MLWIILLLRIVSVGDTVSEESLDTNANNFDNQDNSSTIDKKGRKLDF